MTEREVVMARIFCLECRDTMDKDDWAEWYVLHDILEKMGERERRDRDAI